MSLNHEQLRKLAKLVIHLRGEMKVIGPAPKVIWEASSSPEKVDPDKVKAVLEGYFKEISDITKYTDVDRQKMFRWTERDCVLIGAMFAQWRHTSKITLALLRFEE